MSSNIELILILTILATILNAGYVFYNNYHIMSRPQQWGQPAFQNKQEEEQWINDRQEKTKKADQAEINLEKYRGTEKMLSIISIFGVIISLWGVAGTKQNKIKTIILLIITLIINLFLLL